MYFTKCSGSKNKIKPKQFFISYIFCQFFSVLNFQTKNEEKIARKIEVNPFY